MLIPKLKPAKKLALLLLATCSVISFSARADVKTPGVEFPLIVKNYLLQSFNEQKQFKQVAISDTLSNPYFYANCADKKSCIEGIPEKAMIFRVPSGYGSSSHSEYPRSELRAIHNFYNGEIFDNEQAGEFSVVQAPQTRSIIFAQIHGDKPGGSEMLKLRWRDGQIIAAVKQNYGDKEKRVTLLTGIGLRDSVNYKIRTIGTHQGIKLALDIEANGKSSHLDYFFPESGWKGIALYFKAGNYNQDAKLDGSQAIVAYSRLSLSYR